MADDETNPPVNNPNDEPLTDDTPPPTNNDDRRPTPDENDAPVNPLPNNNDDNDNDDIVAPPLIPDDDDDNPLLPARRHQQTTPPRKPFYILHYTPLSLLLALTLLWYAFRSRGGQFYPAILFLSSSKLSYCVFGNAIIALSVSFFHLLARIFLGGLRSTESESISEGMRWSMTETCLALTMFREEVSINMVGMFLTLTMSKCLHWAIELRGKHLIQTEEAISLPPPPAEGSSSRRRRRPIVPFSHVKYVILVQTLFVLDILALGYCVHTCMEEGPSVHLLFGFESVILSLTASHALLLYSLHVVDGTVTIMGSLKLRVAELIAGVWRDKRFTLTLSIDLFTHAGKFLSYLLFFFLVFTYYGMPINIFRDLYISFQEFKRKILQFISYRRLNRLMSTKFHTVETEEELEECGKVCIICRDAMSVTDGAKKLPGCGHVFHPYCLKGWLMQQQTCPTCRRDIVKASREIPGEGGGAAVAPPATPPTDPSPPPEQSTTITPPPPPSDASSSPAFPSFYKITNPEGATVFTTERDVARTVPVEKLILCTEMTWWRPPDQEARGEMMLKMPDGWVKDGDVKRIVALPLTVG